MAAAQVESVSAPVMENIEAEKLISPATVKETEEVAPPTTPDVVTDEVLSNEVTEDAASLAEEPVAESVIEPTAEAVIEPAAEAVIEEVVAEEPVAEPVIEPSAEVVIEPAAEPVIEPVATEEPEVETKEIVVENEVETEAPVSVEETLDGAVKEPAAEPEAVAPAAVTEEKAEV